MIGCDRRRIRVHQLVRVLQIDDTESAATPRVDKHTSPLTCFIVYGGVMFSAFSALPDAFYIVVRTADLALTPRTGLEPLLPYLITLSPLELFLDVRVIKYY